MSTKETFGSFFHEKRLNSKLSLRNFCSNNGFDPGNISKIERDIMPPPEKKEILEKYIRALQITPKSKEAEEFFDLASISNRKIPEGLSKETVKLLPALCRKIEGQKLTEEEIEKLIELIKKE